MKQNELVERILKSTTDQIGGILEGLSPSNLCKARVVDLLFGRAIYGNSSSLIKMLVKNWPEMASVDGYLYLELATQLGASGPATVFGHPCVILLPRQAIEACRFGNFFLAEDFFDTPFPKTPITVYGQALGVCLATPPRAILGDTQAELQRKAKVKQDLIRALQIRDEYLKIHGQANLLSVVFESWKQ